MPPLTYQPQPAALERARQRLNGQDPREVLGSLAARQWGANKIAKAMGTDDKTIRLWADAWNIALSKRTPPGETVAWRAQQLKAETAHDPITVLRQLAKDGYGTHVIAEILGVCPRTVKNWAKTHQIALPARTVKEKRLTAPMAPETRQRVALGRRGVIHWQGQDIYAIDAAKSLGISVSALRARIKRWGLEKAMIEPKRPPFYNQNPAHKPSPDHPWLQKPADAR